ncbi:MAG: hybrid sensor histidine kinase/response regulator [Verrucomicrobiae bacterium]|nr:hybrid sensor histidine kinase/response regulator [Verrucomicrobiae bacterium]
MQNERYKILLIDDEEVVLDSCVRMLRGGPYEVKTATDGASGLALVREFRPDLVIVDLKMPGISGLEVLEQIRDFDPTIVTIMLTGFATVGSAVDAMKKGACDFLPKPITPDEFRLVVGRALERRRLILETQALRREKELLREQFAAIISHELKSPLGALQQHLFLLAEELADKLTPEQRQRLERMKVRVTDLMKLIQTWLRLTYADLGKIREQFRPVIVAEVIAKAVESVQPEAARKAIEVIVEGADPSLRVVGEEGTLVQALVNLLNNAIKYSPGGSEVYVRAARRDDKVTIAVVDHGVGIPPDELPHVFEDFYRASTGKGETGTGLGLPLCKRIVEAHDGTISVSSQPGKGSTFTIELPAPKPTQGDQP